MNYSVSLNASVRALRAFRALITRERPLHVFSSRSSSASVQQAVRGKLPKCPRVSSHTRLFSSDTDSTENPLEEHTIRLKNDAEVKAWMRQIAQDFEKGREPFQTFADEQDQASSKVDERKASDDIGGADVTPDIEIEDFGYLEDDEEEIEDVAPRKHVPISLDSTSSFSHKFCRFAFLEFVH